jgi:hypothetical protein
MALSINIINRSDSQIQYVIGKIEIVRMENNEKPQCLLTCIIGRVAFEDK